MERSTRVLNGPLQCEIHRARGRIVVRVAGELDEAGGPILERALVGAAASGAPTIELDFGHVAFMDSAGARVLIAARRRAVESGRKLVIVGANGAVLRVVQLLGLERHLHLVR